MGLSTHSFETIQTIVRDRAAIVLDKGKQYFVESRLAPLAEAEGYKNIEELAKALQGSRTPPQLLQALIESLTIHETSFFRDMHPFKAMKEGIIPALLERRATENSLNLWCGASSSGQEPYSVAMLLRENFPQLQGWNVRFIATDISNAVLAKAREGKYSQLEVNRGLPAPLLLKYFEKQGLEWQIKPPVRSAIEFRQLNLVENWPPMPKFDIIMLRNVLIYFDVATKRQILQKLRDLMKPDGFLFLGAAEMPMSIDNAFERTDYSRSGCYQLRAN